ncbi:MFS transporter [Crenobacter sp. SG2303]|uniref:MFS transporter n=1 Tax=Crenobacter oryzisoli TaxID=3056844 RepID=A0ABT7XSV4_9NEIS|nr:MFS transporter [Crenobacter sp. SG2303]MDN0076858.1 MFS transporter [Crenobacter sp. SG2303]
MDATLKRLLLAGGLIVSLGMGIRHGFGFFMPPITGAFGWNREAFALVLGLQNRLWGAAQPFAGALSDRYGSGKVLGIGALLYVAGLTLMTVFATPGLFALTAGVLIGLALLFVLRATVLAAYLDPVFKLTVSNLTAMCF